jgi:hypothetical protein
LIAFLFQQHTDAVINSNPSITNTNTNQPLTGGGGTGMAGTSSQPVPFALVALKRYPASQWQVWFQQAPCVLEVGHSGTHTPWPPHKGLLGT